MCGHCPVVTVSGTGEQLMHRRMSGVHYVVTVQCSDCWICCTYYTVPISVLIALNEDKLLPPLIPPN